MEIEAWHADSLAGPMQALKAAFEAQNDGIAVNLTSGRSKELAERILTGERCDLFAPSDPAVVQGMFGRQVAGREAASWYVVFSANELVVIVPKGNPRGVKRMADMAGSGVRLARVAGESDMATNRTIEFIGNAVAAEGRADLAAPIIAGAAREKTIPEVLKAVREGRADAGIVYLSAAVTVADATETIAFPGKVNLSEKIRNVATIPGTALNKVAAEGFVQLLLSEEGRRILKMTGQPPVVPPLWEGQVHDELRPQ